MFLAGPKDHGFAGRHEYEKDLRVLAEALEAAPNLGNVTTRVYVGKAPEDLSEIADADVFVINSSSDRLEEETHPLFPPDPLTPHRGYDDETTACLEAFVGGRGFVFGGVDYHDNMLIEDYRQFLLNGIVWAGGRDVPNGGVESAAPEGIEPYVNPFPRR